MSEIKFGVTYPAGLQAHTHLKTYVEAVEASGYDSLWLIENIGSSTPGFECLTTLGYMAACSKKLQFGTSVLLLPLRNPILLAQAAATLDQLSGGRLILGIGVGGAEHHRALGSDSATRGVRCDEYLQLLNKLWTETDVTFEGRFHATDRYTLEPRCVQSPHVPVWIGGHSPVVLERAGRLAQGFIPVGLSPAECAAHFESLDNQTRTLGRPPLTRAVHTYLGMAPNVETALDVASSTITSRFQSQTVMTNSAPHIMGSRDDCRRQVDAFLEAGVTHFILDLACRLEDTLEHVRKFSDEVLVDYR